MTTASPYAWLGVAEGAAPDDVHRAAAARTGSIDQDLVAGRVDGATAARAYTDVYAAVVGALGLRLGYRKQLSDLGTHIAAAGAGLNSTWMMTEVTTPGQPTSTNPANARLPCECEICGCFPAVPVSATWVLSILLAAKVQRETKILCRACGQQTARKAQRFTWTWGHFGVGFIAAYIGMARNGSTLRALNEFAAPYARRPGVMAPEIRPRSPGRPVLVSMVLRWAAVAAVVLVLLRYGQ